MRIISTRFRLLLSIAIVCLTGWVYAEDLPFEHVVIDANNPENPHCKTLGDIDGDGYIDAIAASSVNEGIFWYEYPEWTKHNILASGRLTTDMQVADIGY